MTDPKDPPTATMTNRQVEDAAIRYVVQTEKAEGRTAEDTRGRGEAADVLSAGRVIEVKAYGGSARGSDL